MGVHHKANYLNPGNKGVSYVQLSKNNIKKQSFIVELTGNL